MRFAQPIRMVYRRLRDPDKALFWDIKGCRFDHAVIVWVYTDRGSNRLPIDIHDYQPLLRWCREQYGPRGFRPSRNWNHLGAVFNFREPEQAFEFLMRWNGATES